MNFLRRLWEQEPKHPEPVDRAIEWQGTSLILTPPPDRHSHHDYLGNPLHNWAEKRVTAIEAVCKECGRTELQPNHRGRVKGQRSKSAK